MVVLERDRKVEQEARVQIPVVENNSIVALYWYTLHRRTRIFWINGRFWVGGETYLFGLLLSYYIRRSGIVDSSRTTRLSR
jgi:hypothetical protein